MAGSLRGSSVDPVAHLDPAVRLTLSGSSPISTEFHDRESVARQIGSLGTLIVPVPDAGIYIEEVICEGDIVAVIARGRAEMATGLPYNNSYLMWFRVRGDLIVECFEDCDLAMVMTAALGFDLVQSGE
jgi:ketosteroid isomerase-like protein